MSEAKRPRQIRGYVKQQPSEEVLAQRRAERAAAKRKRDGAYNFFIAVFFLITVGILLYPFTRNLFIERQQMVSIVSYTTAAQNLPVNVSDDMLQEARRYNQGLLHDPERFVREDISDYMSLLNVDDSGVIARIQIPRLAVDLPVYHTVEESVLQTAVGHMPGSSLPIGGYGTHVILSGHRGLTTANLFTNLDSLAIGDTFRVTSVGTIREYVIDNIAKVLPDEMELLEIDPEQEYVTLVTCTPYGINSHRLLVRGRFDHTVELAEVAEAHYSEVLPTFQPRVLGYADYMAMAGAGLLIGALLLLVIKAIRKASKRKGAEKS